MIACSRYSLTWMLVLVCGKTALCQPPSIPLSRLGVDRVRLASGEDLFGFILPSAHDKILTIAVQRSWLEVAHPDLYEQQLASEQSTRQKLNTQLVERIEEWMKRRKDDELLLRHLESELQRIGEPKSSSRTSDGVLFFSMTIPREQVRDYTIAKAENRKIAGLAYGNGVDDIVTSSARSLKTQLEELGIDVSSGRVDLLDNMPVIQTQSDKQWAAKQALVEFQYRKPLEFQGTESSLFRSDATPGVADLIKQMSGASSSDAILQLGADLGLPEFKKFSTPQKSDREKWWQAAIDVAEKEGIRGVLIKRLDQNLFSDVVRVDVYFFAYYEGKWFEAFRSTVSANAAEQNQLALDRLKRDPQVQSILALANQLGAADSMERALRHGAATSHAMEEGTSDFMLFLSRHIRRLDGSPVPLAR